jgi:transposase InsO family protein
MSRNAHLIEAHRFGVPVTQLAVDHKISRSWVYVLLKRFKEGGEAALAPRSKAPKRNPLAHPQTTIDLAIRIRKKLTADGFDAGPTTIIDHLKQTNIEQIPSKATVWRWLKKAGLITPQPQKQPKCSYMRFESDLPNETWQSDITHTKLTNGTEIEILNTIDDHSRLCVTSKVTNNTTGYFKMREVIDQFTETFNHYGLPQSVLTDNGAIYTTQKQAPGSINGFEQFLNDHNIEIKHGRPYRPTTQGKVERFHQTMKKYLNKHPSHTPKELQNNIDNFVKYYNHQRIHRAHNQTPHDAYQRRVKAHPPTTPTKPRYRIRHDRTDNTGKITLRNFGTLLKLGIGRKHKHQPTTTLQNGNKTKTYNTTTRQHIATHQLNKNKKYQPNKKDTAKITANKKSQL